MVTSLDPIWLQEAFSTLVGMFFSVGLNTNVGNTFGMVCRLFQAARMQLEAAYGRRITGEGLSYRERQCIWVQYTECGEEMALVSMAVHIHT